MTTEAVKKATSNIIFFVGLWDKYDGAYFFKVFSKNHGFLDSLETVEAAILDSSPSFSAAALDAAALGSLPLLRWVSYFLSFVLPFAKS